MVCILGLVLALLPLVLAEPPEETLVIYNPLAPRATALTVKTVGPSATVLENKCTPSLTEPPSSVATCFDFSLTQGPSTWEYNAGPAWWGTAHASCDVSGGPPPQGTGTCTYSINGLLAELSASTESWSGLFSTMDDMDTVNIVTSAVRGVVDPSSMPSSTSNVASTWGTSGTRPWLLTALLLMTDTLSGNSSSPTQTPSYTQTPSPTQTPSSTATPSSRAHGCFASLRFGFMVLISSAASILTIAV